MLIASIKNACRVEARPLWQFAMALCFIVGLNSCQDQTIGSTEKQLQTGENEMMKIATVFARVLQDPAVGKFIRSEALMKFDEDYDILLQMVVEKEVEPGKPFVDYLTREADGTDVRSLLRRFPLLSIYVPELEIFSAPRWNPESDEISVAIGQFPNEKNEIRILRPSQNEVWQPLNKEPDFPVIILKENERVDLVNSTGSNNGRAKVFFVNDGFSYYFLNPDAEEQARVQGESKAGRMGPWMNFDSKVRAAYTKSQGCASCYHRDYIYYNISPSEGINQGPFDSNYTEAITYFQFENDATAQSVTSNWTEGILEFHINVLFIGASSALTSLEKVYYINSNELYGSNGIKGYLLPSPLVIVPWAMNEYGDRWKFNVVEYDPGTTIAINTSHSTTKSENFSYSTEFSAVIKIGSGYGSSETNVDSNSTTITTTTASNQLGEVVHNWFDPVITVKGQFPPFYAGTYSKEISTGAFKFSCETIRIP